MTLADLAGYEAKATRAGVRRTIASCKVCGMGPPSAGGIAVLAILKQLEGFDLGKLGPDSPTAWHLIAESERLAFADRATLAAMRDFVSVPVAGLVAPDYLKARGKLISAIRHHGAGRTPACRRAPSRAPRRRAAKCRRPPISPRSMPPAMSRR